MLSEARRWVAVAFVVPCLACGAPDPVSNEAARLPAPPPRSGSAPSTSASAPSPVSTEPAPRTKPPLPPAPPGVDEGDFSILASLCAVSIWSGAGKPMVGCRSTPPFDGPAEAPDGSLLEAKDFSEVCFLEDIYRGSFSGPGKDQAILGLAACGDERANDITPGNVVLAENGPDGWRVVAVDRSVNVRGCKQSKRADRTLLVCSDGFGAYGDGSLSFRFTLDFSKPEGSRFHVFSKIYESAASSCMLGNGILEERGATFVDTKEERFEDLDGDGDEDLLLTVERGHVGPSAALVKRADAWCAKQPAGEPGILRPNVLAGKPKRFALRFSGEAETLVPAPATAKLLDAWGGDAPEFWWNAVK